MPLRLHAGGPAAATDGPLPAPSLRLVTLLGHSAAAVKHDDPAHGWLGASPDGLIESLSLDGTASGTAAGAEAGAAQRAGPLAGAGRGILEIKCPFNRGAPQLAVPPPHAIWYYMPQVASRGGAASAQATSRPRLSGAGASAAVRAAAAPAACPSQPPPPQPSLRPPFYSCPAGAGPDGHL